MSTDDPTPSADRRERIDHLLEYATDNESGGYGKAATTLALLEIADAINGLSAEIEKAGWTKA